MTIVRGEDLPPANPYPEAIVDDCLDGESLRVSFESSRTFRPGIKFST